MQKTSETAFKTLAKILTKILSKTSCQDFCQDSCQDLQTPKSREPIIKIWVFYKRLFQLSEATTASKKWWWVTGKCPNWCWTLKVCMSEQTDISCASQASLTSNNSIIISPILSVSHHKLQFLFYRKLTESDNIEDLYGWTIEVTVEMEFMTVGSNHVEFILPSNLTKSYLEQTISDVLFCFSLGLRKEHENLSS